jgi:hypothetical protein
MYAFTVHREVSVIDFLLGFAFVAMILSPLIVASLKRSRTRKRPLAN